MGERTIAEIIGWAPIRWAGTSDDEVIRWQAPDVSWSDGSLPTVDDLLAWLACGAYFLGELIRHDDTWSIKFVNTRSGLDGDWFEGPTLLAALEAAVRTSATSESRQT